MDLNNFSLGPQDIGLPCLIKVLDLLLFRFTSNFYNYENYLCVLLSYDRNSDKFTGQNC